MNNYFFWEGDPVLVTIGEFSLPFALSVPGLILGLVAYFMLPGLLGLGKDAARSTGRERKSRRKEQKRRADAGQPAALPFWQSAGLLAATLIGGQLLFMVLPFPVLQSIGPVMIRWYGVLFASGFLIGYFIGRKFFIDAGKDVLLADKLLTYILVATIVGARLGHVLFYEFEYYSRNLHEILFIWQGGLASHGATIGILFALWLFMKRHAGITFFWLTDRLTIPVMLGGVFIRTGNFFNSEIYGLPTEVPWAVIFARVDMLPRHPTMLYEALTGILILIVLVSLYRYYRAHPPEGLLTSVFMILLFTSRFFVEYTKVEQAAFTETWLFGMGQLLSIPFVLFGIWILVYKVWPARLSSQNTGT